MITHHCYRQAETAVHILAVLLALFSWAKKQLEPVMLQCDDTAFLEYFLTTLPGFLNSS
jgi:hypothetical protein